MKVGPKGQVVIPRTLRKTFKIHPGSKVIFSFEGDKLALRKPEVDVAGLLEKIAKKGRSITQISPHLYEEELAGRV